MTAPPDTPAPWSETGRHIAFRCPLFDVYRSVRRPLEPGSATHDFYVLDARDWVTVVPVLDPGGKGESFLMVRQYRHGIEAVTLEFPAGLAERGELPESAARRELREETGYDASALAHLVTMAANPAFMNNRCHVFAAWGLERTRDLELDPTERIVVRTVPADTVADGMGRGELVNSVTAMSHYFYLRWCHAGPGRAPPRR